MAWEIIPGIVHTKQEQKFKCRHLADAEASLHFDFAIHQRSISHQPETIFSAVAS